MTTSGADLSFNPLKTAITQVYKATDDGFDGAMCDAFDRYGSYCCLDAMMRVLNTTIGLPYLLAIVVFDETGSMLTAIEGLVLLESKVGYRFAFKEMLARYGWINTILSTQ